MALSRAVGTLVNVNEECKRGEQRVTKLQMI
jgi:hypothetical protein